MCGLFFSNRLFYLIGNRDYLSSMCWISLHAAHQPWHNKVLKTTCVFACSLACCENCRYQACFQTVYLSCCAGWWAGEKRERGCPSLPCSPTINTVPALRSRSLDHWYSAVSRPNFQKEQVFLSSAFLPATQSEALLHIFFLSRSAPSLHD